MTLRLSRRSLLKGLGGAVVGLPVLECMLNGNGTAYAQSNEALPRRYALVFAGQSIGGDGWERDRQRIGGQSVVEDGHFLVPTTVGAGYELTTPLEPLAGLAGEVSVVSGLRIPFSATSREPADVPPGGAFREFHGGGKSPLLSGVRSLSGSYTARGVSSDQALASQYAGQTPFGSLVLRAQPSWYLSGSSYAGRQYLSYRGDGDPVEAQTSPQIAFQSLFGGFAPDGESEAGRADFALRARLSVLDLVAERRQRLLSRVGAADRVRLERHFDEIRALEARLSSLPPLPEGACHPPLDPGADPPVGGDNAGTGSDNIGTTTGYSDEATRARVMCDLIHMAFVCDLTRVASLQLTTFQSHMNVFAVTSALGTPIRADVHEVGHNGDVDNKGQLAVSLCLKWHVGHYAYLLEKLRSTPEGDGTALDHAAVVFLTEGGHGTQLDDGVTPLQTHSVEDMALLVAGRAGGLAPGRHLATQGAHPVQALLGAMRGAGYAGDSLGEVTGPLDELFG